MLIHISPVSATRLIGGIRLYSCLMPPMTLYHSFQVSTCLLRQAYVSTTMQHALPMVTFDAYMNVVLRCKVRISQALLKLGA